MSVKTTVTWNSILACYSKKLRNMKEACGLFDRIPKPDIVSYNTMLACYLHNSDLDTARDFFDKMSVKDRAS
jgi:pentatricopeptide repeat protein